MSIVTINSNTFTPDTFFKLPRPDGASSGNEVVYTITTIDGVFTVKVLLNAGIVSNIKLSIGLTQVAEFDALNDLGLSQAAFETLWSDTSPNGEAVILGLLKNSDVIGSGAEPANLRFFLTGDGADVVTLGSGTSTVNLGRGNDTVNGGDGFDILTYDGPDSRQEGVVVNFSGEQAGTVTSNEALFPTETDTFIGIEGVAGTSKNDTFVGTTGSQTFRGGLGNDFMDGGVGIDEVDFFFDGASNGVTVNLAAGSAAGAGTDQLVSIENVRGTDFADSLTGDGLANRLKGEEGADVLSGGGGNDTLEGGSGDDVLIGGAGFDALEGGAGNDTIVGSTPQDITSSMTDRAIYRLPAGTPGELTQTAPDTNGVIFIKLGATDVFRIAQQPNGDFQVTDLRPGSPLGTDTVSKIDELEFFIDAPCPTVVKVQIGVVVNASPSGFFVEGGFFSNVIDAAAISGVTLASEVVVEAGDGNDQILGHDGANILSGEAGNDFIFGRGGDDILFGNQGNDLLNGGAGKDFVRGGAGSDVVDGGGGLGDVSAYDITDLTGDLTRRQEGSSTVISIVNAGISTDLFRVTRVGDSFQVLDLRTDDLDTVSNVAEVAFLVSGTSENEFVNIGLPSIALANSAVLENSGAGTAVGTVSVSDPNLSDAAFFALTDDAGGRFTINSTGEILVARSDLIDFEQATSHVVGVRVTDSSGLAVERSFTIAVQDRSPEVVGGTGGNDVFVGGSGNDRFSGGGGNDSLFGNGGKDTVSGGSGNDYLYGGSGNDTLKGDRGNDYLYGGTGNDTLKGDSGNDYLYGGTGQDTMTGGSGKDRFYFDDKETSASQSKADYITDFKGNIGDRLYLSAIDANTRTARDNKFTFIGEASEFTGTGQVRYEKMNGNTYVYYNNDSDAAADGVIRLKGEMDLAKNWFVL